MPDREPQGHRPALEPGEQELSFRCLVCRISVATGVRLGTGILIGPNRVLTCAHVLDRASKGQVWTAKTIAGLRCTFDCYLDGPAPTTVFPIADRPAHASPAAGGDDDAAESRLDYAILSVNALKGGQDIGNQTLDDGSPRGWLKVDEAGEMHVDLEARMISFPEGNDYMAFSGGGRMIPVAGSGMRVHYTLDGANGSSGGLVYMLQEDGSAVPVALHSGRTHKVKHANDGTDRTARVGTTLAAIRTDFDAAGTVTEHWTSSPNRLKLEIVIAEHGGKEGRQALLAQFAELLENDEVAGRLATLNYQPVVRQRRAADVEIADICRLSEDNSLTQLDKVAQADLVLIFADASDCADRTQRDRLLAAYGYLVARLGQRRVQLIYPEAADDDGHGLTHACFASSEYVHRYEDTIVGCANRFANVLQDTKIDMEDERGLFELARVALGNVGDGDVLGNAHFYAKSSVHILGLRFGNLANRLDKIFQEFIAPDEGATMTIAFPGVEVWKHNAGWLEQIQGGGEDTIAFLQAVHAMAQGAKFPAGQLDRVRFVAINEIPTFILTAADLDTTWGRMLIAPAFQHLATAAAERNKPRLLVRNKLSEVGLFHAYRDALRLLFDPERKAQAGAGTILGTRVRTWTMAETDMMGGYIEELDAARSGKGGPASDGAS